MALEVIVTDEREAALAQRAGANRVELVTARERGGLTPDFATVERVVAAVTIPVHVIVRPHDSGFVYDMRARNAIVHDARRLGKLGAAALVVGGLDVKGNIDRDLLAAIADASDLPFTFHRAFDETIEPLKAYDELVDAPNVVRVLTSGAAASAWEGRALLQTLTQRSGLVVLAGGGITPHNAADIVRATGVRELHVGSGARSGGELDARAIDRLARILREEASA
jgi:copper homeostasis protein